MKYTHEHAFLTSKYHNKLHYITFCNEQKYLSLLGQEFSTCYQQILFHYSYLERESTIAYETRCLGINVPTILR